MDLITLQPPLYNASEEQDSLISKGIALLSAKLLELIFSMREHMKNFKVIEKLPPLYTLVDKKWKTEFLELFSQLQKWEIQHVGHEQFSKSF
jgi:hypothetical protein